MPKQYDSPPAMSIDPAKKYAVTIDTNRGKITLDLFAKDAPKTVNNFVFLARDGFYNGLKFHRVIARPGKPTGVPRVSRCRAMCAARTKRPP